MFIEKGLCLVTEDCASMPWTKAINIINNKKHCIYALHRKKSQNFNIYKPYPDELESSSFTFLFDNDHFYLLVFFPFFHIYKLSLNKILSYKTRKLYNPKNRRNLIELLYDSVGGVWIVTQDSNNWTV
jgi:hypothetical protein